MPAHADADELLAGRYRTLRMLGSGGMAVVYLCRDERLGRLVAVKRLHAHSPEETAHRFAREARVGASLNHPGLVAVYDAVTEGESVLIVMEYVRGETLAQALRRGPLEGPWAAGVVREVAAGLDHAHAHGVVHRDVKPANVLLGEDGTAKLADLGIAIAADQTRITRSGTVLGSAAYMAPEQLEDGEVGPATDVYALAAMAFEALSGRRARTGRNPVEIAHAIATGGAPDLRSAWPDAPAVAAEVVRRGMARDPAERQASAGELARELEDALMCPTPIEQEDTLADAPPTAATRPLPPPPRAGTARTRALAVGALLLALLLGGALVATVLSGGDDPERASHAGDRGATSGAGAQAADPGQARSGGAAAGDEGGETPTSEPGEERTSYAVPEPAGGSDEQAGVLNDRGFALLGQGEYEEAVPVLEEAVRSFAPGTDDIRYAYALFNLGRALRLAGRPEDAIPVLERRLQIPDQTDTVERELALARG